MHSKAKNLAHPWRILGLFLTAIALTGCEPSSYFTNKDLMWVWLLIPLLGIASVGATFVWQVRSSQLAHWRIDQDPVGPGVRPLVMGVVIAALILAALFVAANLQYGDGSQSLVNIGLWLLGSIGGGAGGLLGGLSLAESKKNKG